jgi:ubiquitin-protein ligase
LLSTFKENQNGPFDCTKKVNDRIQRNDNKSTRRFEWYLTLGLQAGPVSEDNYFEWEALIMGPEETPFEDGIFVASLKFPKDYPLSPPTMVRLFSFEPNNTNICRNLLQKFITPMCIICLI